LLVDRTPRGRRVAETIVAVAFAFGAIGWWVTHEAKQYESRNESAEAAQWDPNKLIMNTAAKKFFAETQVCFHDSIRNALLMGMRDRKQIGSFAVQMCKAQISVLAQTHNRQLNNAVEPILEQELNDAIGEGQ